MRITILLATVCFAQLLMAKSSDVIEEEKPLVVSYTCMVGRITTVPQHPPKSVEKQIAVLKANKKYEIFKTQTTTYTLYVPYYTEHDNNGTKTGEGMARIHLCATNNKTSYGYCTHAKTGSILNMIDEVEKVTIDCF